MGRFPLQPLFGAPSSLQSDTGLLDSLVFLFWSEMSREELLAQVSDDFTQDRFETPE